MFCPCGITDVIPAKASGLARLSVKPRAARQAGIYFSSKINRFLLEFIPVKTGTGMTMDEVVSGVVTDVFFVRSGDLTGTKYKEGFKENQRAANQYLFSSNPFSFNTA